MNLLELNNEELSNLSGRGTLKEWYTDFKYIYSDVKKNWDNMQDFVNGFSDGLCGR